MLFAGIAHAMGTRGEGGAGGGFAAIVPLLLMFVIFYFILIRPQQKQARKHQEFLRGLKTGDRVVTSGGVHGEVKGLTETTVTLEVADNVRIKVSRSAVTGSSLDAAATDRKTG